MLTTKTDFRNATIIGAAVGVLFQPMYSNISVEVNGLLAKFGLVAPDPTIRVWFLVGFTVFAPLALFVGSVIGRFVPVIYQFTKFAAVGTLNSFVDFGLLNTGIYLTGIPKGWAYVIFKSISFLAATTNSYFWNKYWTFGAGSREKSVLEIVQFYGITAVAGLVNVGIASFIVNIMGRPEGVSSGLWANFGALIGIFSAMLFNFFGYKYIVFGTQAGGGKVAELEKKAEDWIKS